MKTNYFSRKLILSLAASIALAASPSLIHGMAPITAGTAIMAVTGGDRLAGTGWPRYRGRVIGGALAYPSYAQPECWVQYDQWGQAYRACR